MLSQINTTYLCHPWTVLPVAVLALSASGSAIAQIDIEIEEITVTATKRETTVRDIPFSINVQTQQDIQRSGANTIEELSRNIAGLTVQNLGPGQSQVAIRGVSAGQIIRDQPGVKEQVGVYLDESVISLSLFTPDFDLYDLNRVETLRGPQGTLFGSGSIGGTIRYITNAPDVDAFDASIELDLNTVTDGDVGGHVKGMVNIPLAEGSSALRLVGYTTEYAGFIDARRESTGTFEEDVNSGNRSGARAALTFQPTDNLSITPRIIYQEITTDGFNRQEVYNLFANPNTDPAIREPIQLGERQQHLLLDEEFSDETTLFDLVASAGFDRFDLTFVGSFMSRDILVSRDASALTGSVSVDLEYADDEILLPSNLRDTTDLEQTTFELRANSNNDGPFQWLVGAFYADTDREYAQRLPTPGYQAATDRVLGDGTSEAVSNGFPNLDSPFNSDLPFNLEQFAVFGEVSYDFTDSVTLTAGGRFYDFDESRTITSGGLFANGDFQESDSTSADGFNPRVMLSWDLNDEVTLNAQASQGFRLGGVNDPLNVTLCTADDIATFGPFQKFEDETLWNYEVGIKSGFANGIAFNAAVFYADVDDLQVNLDANDCSSRVAVNVEESHAAGVELEFSATPAEGLNFSVAGSFLEAEFDSTFFDVNGQPLAGIIDGNRLASVPEYQLAAAGSYDFPLNFGNGGYEAYVAASVQHVGDRITQPSDQLPGAGNFVSGLAFGGATGNEVTALDLELDAYTIVNLSAGIIRNNWEAVLYIKNVGDENANLSFDRERGGRARLSFRTNDPRTIGVTFRMRFSD